MARRATRQAEKPVTRPAPQLVRTKLTKAVAKTVQPKTAPKSSRAGTKSDLAPDLKAPDLKSMTADQKVAALLREREALVTRLHAAETRIAAMEARDEQLSDRIAWALDTLTDLLRLPDVP